MTDWINEVAIISTYDEDRNTCRTTIKSFMKTSLFIEDKLLNSVYFTGLKNNNYTQIQDNEDGNLHRITDFVFTDEKVYHVRLLDDLKE